ncbi:MAG TPA: hypothetical protein VF850_14890 [Gemmatimonadaceae bacterium]
MVSRARPRQYWLPSLIPWLLISLSGCLTWATLPTPAPGQQFQGAPDRIDVVRTNGSSLTLDNPSVVGDSLVGYVQKGRQATRVALLLSDLQLVETEEFSTPRTIALVLWLAPVAIYFWWLSSQGKNY